MALLPLATAALACGLLAGCGGKGGRNGREAPAAPVTVAAAVTKTVPLQIETFGTIEPMASVVVRSQITGVLTNVAFQEGQEVKPGDLLFFIDATPWENARKQAEAALAGDEAERAHAQKEADREKELLAQGLTAQDAYDAARAAADKLAARVRADEAAVENARIECDYCRIRSPIAGRTGQRRLDVGNLVKADDTPLVVVNQVKPVKVSFSVPQQHLGTLTKQMAAGPLAVRATVPDDAGPPETGVLTFVDNAVDPTTGTLSLRAEFANESSRLWPGQFVRVALVLAEQPDAIVVPSRAVKTGQEGAYVFVVKPDLTAEMRPVKVGRTFAEEAIVAEGLQAGETVVVEGQQRLARDAKVVIKDAPSPAATAKP